MFKRVILTLIFSGYAVFSLAQSSLSNKQTLVIATYQYGDNPRINNIQPFATHFSSIAEVQTEVKSYPTVHQLLQAMKNGEVDIAFINTFGYLMLREQSQSYEISAALHLPSEAASVYRSMIVTNKKNKIQSLEMAVKQSGDLMLAFVSPGSTSGNLVPRLKLASLLDVEPEMVFLEVQYAERHNLALRVALENDYALAAFGSEEYYKLGADTTLLTKLWESPPIQLGPVMVKKGLSENIKSALEQTLLDLHQQNTSAFESIKTGWAEAQPADQFMLIDEAYYESLFQLAGNRDRTMKIIRRFAK